MIHCDKCYFQHSWLSWLYHNSQFKFFSGWEVSEKHSSKHLFYENELYTVLTFLFLELSVLMIFFFKFGKLFYKDIAGMAGWISSFWLKIYRSSFFDIWRHESLYIVKIIKILCNQIQRISVQKYNLVL